MGHQLFLAKKVLLSYFAQLQALPAIVHSTQVPLHTPVREPLRHPTGFRSAQIRTVEVSQVLLPGQRPEGFEGSLRRTPQNCAESSRGCVGRQPDDSEEGNECRTKERILRRSEGLVRLQVVRRHVPGLEGGRDSRDVSFQAAPGTNNIKLFCCDWKLFNNYSGFWTAKVTFWTTMA